MALGATTRLCLDCAHNFSTAQNMHHALLLQPDEWILALK